MGLKLKNSSRDLIYKLPEYSNITSNNKSKSMTNYNIL